MFLLKTGFIFFFAVLFLVGQAMAQTTLTLVVCQDVNETCYQITAEEITNYRGDSVYIQFGGVNPNVTSIVDPGQILQVIPNNFVEFALYGSDEAFEGFVTQAEAFFNANGLGPNGEETFSICRLKLNEDLPPSVSSSQVCVILDPIESNIDSLAFLNPSDFIIQPRHCLVYGDRGCAGYLSCVRENGSHCYKLLLKQ